MRTALALTLLLLLGCSTETDQPTSGAAPLTERPSPSPPGTVGTRELDAATRVAVAYVAAVREHDAAAIYELAWSGLRQAQTRPEFVAATDLEQVSDARISGIVQVGWSAEGQRLAIAPVIVTADQVRQIGRVLLVRERGRWRYLDVASPDQVPGLTQERPKGP